MDESGLSFQRKVDRKASRLANLTGVRLRDDEEILFTGIIHPAIAWKAVAVLVLAAIFLFVAVNMTIFLALVGIVMLIVATVTRRYLMLAATTHRILIRGGIIYTDVIEMHYRQMESVEVGATLIGQLFGYVNVIVTGAGNRRVMVPFVANGVEFKRVVNDRLIERDQQ